MTETWELWRKKPKTTVSDITNILKQKSKGHNKSRKPLISSKNQKIRMDFTKLYKNKTNVQESRGTTTKIKDFHYPKCEERKNLPMIQNIRAHGWNRVEVKSLPGCHGCFWNVLIFIDDEAHDGAAEWIKTSTKNPDTTTTQNTLSFIFKSISRPEPWREDWKEKSPDTHHLREASLETWKSITTGEGSCSVSENSDRLPHLPSQLKPQSL